MEKNTVKRKSPTTSITAEPALFENEKEATATLFFASCSTCFNFLKIPVARENNVKQTMPDEEAKL